MVVLLPVLGGTFEVESNNLASKPLQPNSLRLRGPGLEALEEQRDAVWVNTKPYTKPEVNEVGSNDGCGSQRMGNLATVTACKTIGKEEQGEGFAHLNPYLSSAAWRRLFK